MELSHLKKLYAFNRPITEFFKLDDDLVYWKDVNGLYLGGNDRLANLAKLRVNNIPGIYDSNVTSKIKFANMFRHNDWQVVAKQKTIAFIESAQYKSKDTFSVLSLKTPLRGSDNKILGSFGISMKLGPELKTNKRPLSSCLDEFQVYNLVQCCPALIKLREKKITRREAEMLYYFIRCKTVKKVAQQMGEISVRTVDDFLNACKRKLGVYSTETLVELLWNLKFQHLNLSDLKTIYFNK